MWSLEIDPRQENWAKFTTPVGVFHTDDTRELLRARAMGITNNLALLSCFGPYVVRASSPRVCVVLEWYEDMTGAEIMLDGVVTAVYVHGKFDRRIKTAARPTIEDIAQPGLYSRAWIQETASGFIAQYN